MERDRDYLAKTPTDAQALLAAVAVNEDYLRATLSGLLPEDDARHGEMADLLRRFQR